ncbi:unnamed protein product [Schistosoma intercalatum]|nr:unnamed protein product [Schistosoma intercalatum]
MLLGQENFGRFNLHTLTGAGLDFPRVCIFLQLIHTALQISKIEKAQGIQKEIQKIFQLHRQLSAQLSENENVIEDFGLLNESNAIYKLVGPVLVKQDLSEAKETVSKRISYITSEM